ncbi:hypothetical protein [Rhizorhabdus sp.]|uniref:hypothetical protein n=1 Tax=Rhizorhabdus sp. TaxID=1968843 RepID=UPI0019A8BE60|nr:hypothetical protein [Rhizorhabdus sp.]MBD3761918.1 hypothetical protein [Rhizorhabdus sp.]
MNHQVTDLARMGNWPGLLHLVRATPDWINLTSEPKGYAPLHQAAWHGADLPVVGELLRLGADAALKTRSKQQSPLEIAREKHPARDDLHFLLTPRRTLAQLMRKIIFDNDHLFPLANDRRVVADAIVATFQANVFHLDDDVDLEMRLAAVFQAVTTLPLENDEDFRFYVREEMPFSSDLDFWRINILHLLEHYRAMSSTIPLAAEWAVIADLFEPLPSSWGFRGDPYLWLEMRYALCHAPIPEDREALRRRLVSAFTALTGASLDGREGHVVIERFARGGMSSGGISFETWNEKLIPLLVERASWLHGSWRRF